LFFGLPDHSGNIRLCTFLQDKITLHENIQKEYHNLKSGTGLEEQVWKDWEGGRIPRIVSPVINVFLKFHVECVSYLSGDYCKERLVHSITVLHVVQIHINITLLFIM
jgi:hypothetical protein